MESHSTFDTIRTFAAVLSACGIFVAVLQLRTQRLMWRTQHRRSRREKAVDVIRIYISSMIPSWSATTKLVERLTAEQLIEMDEGREFAIEGKEAQLLSAALPDEIFKPGESQIRLSREQSYKLRHQALAVLNAVEVVFQAWYWDVAEAAIIEEEMAYLRDTQANPPATLMQTYREALRMEKNYPALHRYLAGKRPQSLA